MSILHTIPFRIILQKKILTFGIQCYSIVSIFLPLTALQVPAQVDNIDSFTAVEKMTLSDLDIQNMISSGSYARTHHGVLNCAVKRAGQNPGILSFSLF